MLHSVLEIDPARAIALCVAVFFIIFLFTRVVSPDFKWRELGTSFSVMWLYNYQSGMKLPPHTDLTKLQPEDIGAGLHATDQLKKSSFLQVMDIGVERFHAEDGGWGIPNSFLAWHWGMVGVYFSIFTPLFYYTTPGAELFPADAFPWMTLVKKLVIFFGLWESLGLGVIHGPLHAKMSPPFQDWWYRLTPGTMKWNAPFMRWLGLGMKRNYLDVLVEGFLTYIFGFYALFQPEVTTTVMYPVMLCAMYEFIFDYGQHLHDYGTQNLHVFICCCFEPGQGQLAGIQLFLNFFYFCSGCCKLGPTFQYFFTNNLTTAKFMVDVPWAGWWRRTMFTDHKNGDYTLRPCAYYFATFAACIEMLVPLLTWSNDEGPVSFSILTFICMHVFIISTLIIDVFAWNFTDAVWYVVLYGIVHTGVDWQDLGNMHPMLAAWLGSHVLYVVWGHIFPDDLPFVAAHRHAAGNFAQGVLVIKKSAAAKLTNVVSHAGAPSQGPGWMGEWSGFHGFLAYTWNWNINTKLLPALILDAMKGGVEPVGPFHASGDFIFIHSVLFFDAICAHVRFDGMTNIDLVEELGRVCGFEDGECKLCWAGAFPTFLMAPIKTPMASWKIIDACSGVIKEGKYSAADVTDPAYAKPSDLPNTRLPGIVAGASKKTN